MTVLACTGWLKFLDDEVNAGLPNYSAYWRESGDFIIRVCPKDVHRLFGLGPRLMKAIRLTVYDDEPPGPSRIIALKRAKSTGFYPKLVWSLWRPKLRARNTVMSLWRCMERHPRAARLRNYLSLERWHRVWVTCDVKET